MNVKGVYGKGILAVGDGSVEITKESSYVDLDCDLEEVYKGATNYIGNCKLTDFPEFGVGGTGITLEEGITKVFITPRWFVV